METHEVIKKIERRDSILRFVEFFVVVLALGMIVFVATLAYQTQKTVERNQSINVERIERRNDQLKAYLTCVLQTPVAARTQEAYDRCNDANPVR